MSLSLILKRSRTNRIVPFLVGLLLLGLFIKVRTPGLNHVFAYSFEDHMNNCYTLVKSIFHFFASPTTHTIQPISNDPTYFDGHYILVALASFIVLFLKKVGIIAADISQHDLSLFIYTGRHLSLFLQAGTLLLTYATLNCLTKRVVLNGILTTLLITFCPLWFRVDLLRLDHFLCFATALAIYCATKTLKNPNTIKWHIGNGISSALILSTKLTSGLYLILTMAIYGYLIINKKLSSKAVIAVTISFVGCMILLFFRWLMHAPLILPTLKLILLEASIKVNLLHTPSLMSLLSKVWVWESYDFYRSATIHYTLNLDKLQIPIHLKSPYLFYMLLPRTVFAISLIGLLSATIKKQCRPLLILCYIFLITLYQLFTPLTPRYLTPFPIFYCLIMGISLNYLFLFISSSTQALFSLQVIKEKTRLLIPSLVKGCIIISLCLPIIAAQSFIELVHLRTRRQETVANELRLKGKDWINTFCKKTSTISHYSSKYPAIISVPLNDLPMSHLPELINCKTRDQQTTTMSHIPITTKTISPHSLSQKTDILVLSSRRTQTHLHYLEQQFQETPLNNHTLLEKNIALYLPPLTTTQFINMMRPCLGYLWATQDTLSHLIEKQVLLDHPTPASLLSKTEQITQLLNQMYPLTEQLIQNLENKNVLHSKPYHYALYALYNALMTEFKTKPISLFHDIYQSIWKESLLNILPGLTTMGELYFRRNYIDIKNNLDNDLDQMYLQECNTLRRNLQAFKTQYPSSKSLTDDYLKRFTQFKTQLYRNLPHIFQNTYQISLKELNYDTLMTILGPKSQIVARQGLYDHLNKTPHIRLQSPYRDNDLYWVKLYVTNPNHIKTKKLATSLFSENTVRQNNIIKTFRIPHHMETLIQSIDTEVRAVNPETKTDVLLKRVTTEIPERHNRIYPFYAQWLPKRYQSTANWAAKMNYMKTYESPLPYEQTGAFFHELKKTLNQEHITYKDALRKKTHLTLTPLISITLSPYWETFKDLSLSDFNWDQPLNPEPLITQVLPLPPDIPKSFIRTRYRINLTHSSHGEWTDKKPLPIK